MGSLTMLCWSTVMVLCNSLFLAYTAVIAPVQICLWNYNDPCNSIATLYFDAFVDIFFLVRSLYHLSVYVGIVRIRQG